MTPRCAKAHLLAPRLWAALSTMALALVWGADAHAGCAGRAHAEQGARSALANLSPEVVGGEPAAPLRPGGCTGAFCGKPAAPAGMDFSGGVDIRLESWACDTATPRPDLERGSPLIAESDDPTPATRRDPLVEPPR